MKINKTIILSDIISIFIAFWLFIWIFMEMKCVIVINNRVLNVFFSTDLIPLKKISLGRNKCQEPDTYSLFNYTFAGIKENCLDTKTQKLIKDTCDKPSLQVIEEIPSKNLSIWRNKIMCVSYFNDEEKNSYILKNADEECEDGSDSSYRQCGFINTKTNNSKIIKKYCLKKNVECPLNFIHITKDISEYQYVDEEGNNNYTILPFEDNEYYLVTSNKMIQNSIIINVQISEGEYPCYLQKRFSSQTQQFPGLNNLVYFNCKGGGTAQSGSEDVPDKNLISEYGYDTRYVKFDEFSKIDVLKDNDLDYSYNKLPNLTNWNQDIYIGKFSLFYKDSYTVKNECERYDEMESSTKSLTKIQTFRVLFALIHIMIYVVLFSILGLMKVVFSWYHSLLFGIKVGISYVIFGVNYLLIYFSINNKKTLLEVKQLRNCLDEVQQAIADNYGIQGVLDDLTNLYFWEKIMWYGYCFFNFIETCRLVHKAYIWMKNRYRRNIAYKEIGSENLIKIFEKVRGELDKKKQKIKWQ